MARFRSPVLVVLALAAFHHAACTPRPHPQAAAFLGTAASFTVLAGSTVTNTGPTTVVGDLGVDPGLAVTGFPPGAVTGGTIHAGDAVALQAQSDVTTAYNTLAGLPCDHDLTGQDLGGGRTLTPGVYCFSSSAQLTGALTLDAEGNADALFVFQIGSTLTTASDASVLVINGAQACNAYWQVGSSATLGTTTTFVGTILALTSISLTTGVQVFGRALARNGAVTMDTNHLEAGACVTDAGAADGGVADGGMADASGGGDGAVVDSGAGGGDGAPVDGGGGGDAGMDATGMDASGTGDGGADGGGADGGGDGAMDAMASGDGGSDAARSDGAPRDAHVDSGGGSDGGGMTCCVGVACGTTCVDLSADPNNCGACGATCAPSQFCSGGACTTCLTLCAGACADLASDHDNCGACGRVCPPGQACTDRACGVCSGTLCGGTCASLQTDPFNCGACGRACGLNATCAAGVCASVCP